MTGSLSPRVDPAATVELVDLIRQQLHRLIKEYHRGATTPPNVAYQLAGALENLLRDLPIYRVLDADAVARVRRSVQVGRRLDMAEAFNQLNPQFGMRAEHGCWDLGEHRAQQAAVHRRELGLSLGDRVADVLDPPAEPVGVAG
jgi:hypothetical protein